MDRVALDHHGEGGVAEDRLRHEYQNLRLPERNAAAGFYHQLAAHISEQTEAAIANGTTDGKEALALVSQITMRANQAPVPFTVGGHEINVSDPTVRDIIGTALSRAAALTMHTPEHAEGEQLLLDTLALNEGQALAVQTELERFFGALPASGQGVYITEIPGLILHYHKNDNDDPNRVIVTMSFHKETAGTRTSSITHGHTPTAPGRVQSPDTQTSSAMPDRSAHSLKRSRFRPATGLMPERPDLDALTNDGARLYADLYGAVRLFHAERTASEAGRNAFLRLLLERMVELDYGPEPAIADHEVRDKAAHTALELLHDGLRAAVALVSPTPGVPRVDRAILYQGPANDPVSELLENELEAFFLQTDPQTTAETSGQPGSQSRNLPTLVPGYSLQIETRAGDEPARDNMQILLVQDNPAAARPATPSP